MFLSKAEMMPHCVADGLETGQLDGDFKELFIPFEE